MDAFTIVRPEHLNHRGSLFGGQLLLWVDEYSWIAAARELRNRYLVTRGMDSIDFKIPVPKGSILRFHVQLARTGKTSVTYRTEVFSDDLNGKEETLVFSTHITFVSVDKRGQKQELSFSEDKRE